MRTRLPKPNFQHAGEDLSFVRRPRHHRLEIQVKNDGTREAEKPRSKGCPGVRVVLGLAAILCLSAAASEPQIAGRYVLETANGSDLPAAVAENRDRGYRQEVASGWMVLGADLTFTWRTVYRTTENGSVRTNESGGKGRYNLNGKAVSLTPDGTSAALEGTLSRGTLTVQADVKLVYRKEDGTLSSDQR
jgi:hypothetical protein